MLSPLDIRGVSQEALMMALSAAADKNSAAGAPSGVLAEFRGFKARHRFRRTIAAVWSRI